ncbi:MAG: hypothetical protein ACPL4K_02595 [Candidatus Margulisiibacteriota bacterium]
MMFNFKTALVGKISEEFTFAKVKEIAWEIISPLEIGKILIIGYDSRFLADKFAEEIVKVAETKRIFCYLLEPDVPISTLAWEVEEKKAVGGIMISGGSLPYDFCGIKFIAGKSPAPSVSKSEKVERFNPSERYLKYLEGTIDSSFLKQTKPKIIVDPMYGSARGYMDKILTRLGCKVKEIHDYRDVLFGGKEPNPVEENLGELKELVAQFDLGLAFNSDASEFTVVDSLRRFYPKPVKQDAILESLLVVERFARTGKVVERG